MSEKKSAPSTKGMLLDVTKYRISESLVPPLLQSRESYDCFKKVHGMINFLFLPLVQEGGTGITEIRYALSVILHQLVLNFP